MKKIDILYDWPISEITRMGDSEIAESFAESLDEMKINAFSSLTEKLRELGARLESAKANRAHFAEWHLVDSSIKEFEEQFSTFPDSTFKKFRIFSTLAGKISSSGVALDDEEIDVAQFHLRRLGQSSNASWFSHENNTNFENSLVILGTNNLELLGQEFERDVPDVSPSLVFHTLAQISECQDFSDDYLVLVKRTVPPISGEAIAAFANLAVLASGKSIHVPRRYRNPPHIATRESINPENDYHQWNELLGVLSEYNSRDEVLMKFLTLYHVFENLMFKRPIVQLELQQSGRMFSIRDFRRLYDQVNMAEATALGRLFASIFKISAGGTSTFEHRIVHRWKGLVPNVREADIEHALKEMKISKKYSDFKLKHAAGYFSEIVYALRCAIVHNKETEFHLTYASLTAGFAALIESFMLPSLEELCFAVICSPNTEVWYQNKQISLY